MTHSTRTPEIAVGAELIDPAEYARNGYPHETFTRLRRDAPVYLYEAHDYPFWAVTRHADIVAVSRQPARFSNLPRFQIAVGAEFGSDDAREPNTIIQMDPPLHRRYRELLSRRFTPRALRGLESEIDAIAAGIIDDWAAEAPDGECDFVERVAAPFPIAVIASMLDLPRRDWSRLYHWTNAVVGAADPEYQQPGEGAHETRLRASNELYEYFAELAEERRSGTGDDLVSALARAEVGGAPLPAHDLVSYYLLLVTAGNETTRNAITGGVLAFLEAPECWQQLQGDESLSRPAAEEILRWTTPVIQMARTATQDVELGGQKIRTGDTLALFYASANRDEAVFDEPFRFRIDRWPNPHLSFGAGEHFCMGAHLARIEVRAMFRQLARRLSSLGRAGPPLRLQSSAVGGIKQLPIRYAIAP